MGWKKITYDLLKDEDYKKLKDNPYFEKNPLIFATGPVTGTIRPSSGRYSVTGISPLTGIWGEGTSGGYFCISLHKSGYDALVLTGKSEEPVYIYIHDGKIEFKNASKLWGKDTYQLQEEIKKELENERIRIAGIGPAGENLVRYASIVNDDGRVVGRTGMGALMGSKKLKAIAIHGLNKIDLANPQLGKVLYQNYNEKMKEDFLALALHHVFNVYGTNCYLDIGMTQGDTPAYYFTENEFLAEKVTGKTIKEQFPQEIVGCAGCSLKCGKKTYIEIDGEQIIVDGPEYESVASLGPTLGLFKPYPIIYTAHKFNIYGMDTISGGVSIAFLIYLVENNLGIDKIKEFLEDIEITEISWGNEDLISKLTDKIVKREGIGDILAHGVKKMAEVFEVDPELAAHVKGLEVPMHDPRAFEGQALTYATCCIGANHEKGNWFAVEVGNFSYPRLRIKPGKGRFNIKGREKGVAALQDISAINDSSVVCNFINPDFDDILGYINSATGFDYDKRTLMRVGERIHNIKRVISCKLGITRQDDKIPGILKKPLSNGKTAGVNVEIEENLKKYYKERDWDWESGHPNASKLEELG
ncbi:MAG: aldehyde ferredoxin oxidoreductase family protein, partial [Candidatus Lokiarchaeota archaeon]